MATQKTDQNQSTQLFTVLPAIVSCIGMLAAGGILAAYGPTIPGIEQKFHIGHATAGKGLTIRSICAVFGILGAEYILKLWGNRSALLLSYTFIISGAIIISLGSDWPIALIGIAFSGLGFGSVDVLISQLFSVGFGNRSVMMITIGQGFFSLGTIITPAITTWLGTQNYPIIYTIVALLCVIPVITIHSIPSRPTIHDFTHTHSAASTDSNHTSHINKPQRIQWWILIGFVLLNTTHFSLQNAIGTWEIIRLTALGIPIDIATLATTGYWLASTLSRFAMATIAKRFSPSVIVTLSCYSTCIALIIAFYPDATIYAYLLAGLCMGPAFPYTIAWMQNSGATSGSIYGYVISLSMLLSSFFPAIIGILINQYGTLVLAPMLTVLAATAIISIAIIRHYRYVKPNNYTKNL